MTVSQNLQPAGNGNNVDWFDEITVTDVPKGQFLAVTANDAPTAGSTTRNITVQCMQGGAWADGGTLKADPGLYVRQSGEAEVCVKILDSNGTEVAMNTTNYSS